MKQRNTAVNILTAFVATLLSIVLVLALFATGLVGAARTAVTPKAMENMITQTVQDIDFEQLLIGSAEDNNVSQEDLAQAQIINELMNSEAAQEFFALYAKDMAAALSGTYTAENAAVSGQVIRDLAEKHIDDMVDILGELDSEADREQIRQEVLKYIDENADTLLGDMSVETIVSDSGLTDVVEVIDVLPTILWVLVAVCAVLAGLIYACRYYRFGGFMWIGVDTALAATLMLGVTRALKSNLLLELLNEMGAEDILAAVFGAVGNVFATITWILFGAAVLFIGGYIALKCTVLKQKDAAAPAVFTVGDDAPAAELPATEETL